METPLFAFRLPKDEAQKVRKLASIFYDGAPNKGSQFCREMLRAITSGDQAKLVAFLSTLQVKLTGQLQLELQAAVDSQKAGQGKRPGSPKKGGRRVTSPR